MRARNNPMEIPRMWVTVIQSSLKSIITASEQKTKKTTFGSPFLDILILLKYGRFSNIKAGMVLFQGENGILLEHWCGIVI
jgi:hypothetical protein